MRRLFRHLRTQISASMIALAVTTLLVFILGMAVFYVELQEQWVDGLSEDNRRTLETLIANGEVNPDELTTLVNAFSLSWSGFYADQEFIAVLAFSLVALVCAVVFGMLVARRLSRPIEAVTQAAQQVAGGALDMQVSQRLGTSLEIRNLLDSFNQMTRSLEQAERESAASAAAIAHELRTPLTILRGRLQGIADRAFEPTPDMMHGLVGQVDTLSRIVDDLALLSRLSAGRFELEIRATDLADEARTTLMSLGPELEREGFTIAENLEPAPLEADGARIRQALNALIDNARQYAGSGKFIRVETGIEDGHAMVRVSDRGPGIAAQDRERIFDRWWRGDESRARSKGGSGLGLSIVRAIARAHGGEAGAVSNETGGGATFTMLFPRADSAGAG